MVTGLRVSARQRRFVSPRWTRRCFPEGERARWRMVCFPVGKRTAAARGFFSRSQRTTVGCGPAMAAKREVSERTKVVTGYGWEKRVTGTVKRADARLSARRIFASVGSRL